MFLLILESIGTPELILIGIVALILFGPRKLPQMAKTIGKTMAEFRSATNEFKTTWEKEAALEEEKQTNFLTNTVPVQKMPSADTVKTNYSSSDFEVSQPQIKEVSLSEEQVKELFKNKTSQPDSASESQNQNTSSSKRDWL